MKINRSGMLLTAVSVVAIAYENKAGWKKADDGSFVMDSDGNPIHVDSDGKETTIAPGYINRLNTEAASHRQRANEAESKLKSFEGLDAKEAKAALTKLKDVDLDNLVNKGEIENVRTQLREQFEAEISTTSTKLSETQAKLERLALENAFNSSEFLKNRLALPVDAARATFRDRFKIEDDKVIPLNERGEPLINKHGDVATVDEAFEAFISGRKDADQWIKAPEVGGSGSSGAGGGSGATNKIKRADFDALPADKRNEIGQKSAKGEIQIVD